jgi:hypothetical protein
MSLMKGGPSHFDMDDAFCIRWTYEFKPRRGCYLLIRLGLASALAPLYAGRY